MRSARDIDGGWAWLVLIGSYVNLLLASGLAFIGGMFQVMFLEQFQGSVAFTSWVTALFSSMMQLGGPISSTVANCTNCRVAVMVGGACWALGLALSGFANSLEFLFVSLGVLAGTGMGLVFTSSIVIVNYYFDRRRSIATGLALSAAGLGIVLAPQIATTLLENLSWREALVAIGAMAAQSCIAGALMFPVHERKNQQCTCASGRCFPCTCFPCINKSNGEGALTTNQKITANNGMDIFAQTIEYVETNTPQNDLNANKDVDDLHCDYSDTRSGSAALPGGCCQKPATEPLLLDRQTDLASSDQDGPESFVKQHKSSIPNYVNYNLLAGQDEAGHLPEIPKHKTLLDNKGHSHIDMASVKMENYQRLRHPASTSSVSLDKIPKRKMPLLGNRRAFQCQSHTDLPRHPISFKARGGQSQYTTDNDLYLRSWSLDLKNPRYKQNSMSNINLSRDILSQHVIVVAKNQSLTSVVPSCTIENFEPAIIDCEQQNMNIKSNTSLYSSSLSFKHGLGNAATSFKLSVKSMPLSQADDGQPQSLWCSAPFWILCLQLFLANSASGIYVIHWPSFVKSRGLTDHEMTNIMSIYGVAVLFGRIAVGMLANAAGYDFHIYWAVHILTGIALLLMPVVPTNFSNMTLLAFISAIYHGSSYSVLTTLTIQYVGLSNLATAFGIEMISGGFGYLVAPPCAGILVDLSGNYENSILFDGVLMILSSLVLMLLPVLKQEVTMDTQLDSDRNVDLSEDEGKVEKENGEGKEDEDDQHINKDREKDMQELGNMEKDDLNSPSTKVKTDIETV